MHHWWSIPSRFGILTRKLQTCFVDVVQCWVEHATEVPQRYANSWIWRLSGVCKQQSFERDRIMSAPLCIYKMRITDKLSNLGCTSLHDISCIVSMLPRWWHWRCRYSRYPRTFSSGTWCLKLGVLPPSTHLLRFTKNLLAAGPPCGLVCPFDFWCLVPCRRSSRPETEGLRLKICYVYYHI